MSGERVLLFVLHLFVTDEQTSISSKKPLCKVHERGGVISDGSLTGDFERYSVPQMPRVLTLDVVVHVTAVLWWEFPRRCMTR